MNGTRHTSNARDGKRPSTENGKHNRHAGHARALRQIGHRASRRKANRRFKEWTRD